MEQASVLLKKEEHVVVSPELPSTQTSKLSLENIIEIITI